MTFQKYIQCAKVCPRATGVGAVTGIHGAWTNAVELRTLQAMRASQGQELATRDEPVRAEVLGEFCRIQEAERQAAASVSMLALVNRADKRTEHSQLNSATEPPPEDGVRRT